MTGQEGETFLAPSLTGVFQAKDSLALASALADMNYGLRLNERAARVEVKVTEHRGWEELDDHQEAYLRDFIAKVFVYQTTKGTAPLKFGRDAWADAINAICHLRRVDPFHEWINRLPAWDGEARLEFMLSQVFDAEVDDLSKWASRTVLVGAIVRARHPGAPLDEIAILLGPQGIGKSKIWPALLPAAYREDWFSDGLDFSGRLKEQVESTLGRVIVEAGELAGLAGSDTERLKTYISRTNDGSVRLAYAHRPVAMKRRFVVIGTTNDPECLPNDPTGNRRFVVVKCPRNAINAAVEDWADEHREQLWAEARHMADDGDTGRLPFNLHGLRDARNVGHRSANETVEGSLASLDYADHVDGASMVDLIDTFGKDTAARTVLERAHPRELARALNALGWRQRRIRRGGRQARYWFPPEKTS